MKVLVLVSVLFFTCASAKNLECHVTFGLNCRVLNGDVTGVESVTFDIGELDVEDFETVSLIETKMNDVPSGIFTYFLNAIEFVLSENGLKQWKPEYLKGAAKLTILMVTENSITSIPANAFAEAPNLKIVDLNRNNIAQISSNAFAGLHQVTDLRLQSNQFGPALRVDTFSEVASSLKRLNIAENKIEKIPEGLFKNLKNLEKLTIYYNEKIGQVDGEIFPESLKEIVGLIQFKINNPPPTLVFQLDDYHFGKRDEL